MRELIPLFPLATPLFPGVVLPLQIFEPRYRRLMSDLLALPEDSDARSFGVVAIRQGWEVESISPAAALYDIGCTARLQRVHAQRDGGYRIVTVGGERFRVLEVHVGDDLPYLQAEVEWLAEEEAAEGWSGDAESADVDAGRLLDPTSAGTGTGLDEVASSVARGSMDVLVRGVRDLFARYVTEVALLGTGRDGEPRDGAGVGESAEAAVLLRAVSGDPAALSWLVASTALLTTEDRQILLAESATRRRLATESRLLRRELTLLQELGAVPVPLHQFATPMTVN